MPRKRGGPKPVIEYAVRRAMDKKLGRPTIYHPDMNEMATRFCLLGATDEELGRSFDVDEATVKRWMVEHDLFRASVSEGREIADAKVASSLYHKANGYSHPAEKIFVLKVGDEVVEHRAAYTERFPPSDAAAIFWLKNRRRDLWRDTPPVIIQNNTQVVSSSADPVEIGQSYRSIVDESE